MREKPVKVLFVFSDRMCSCTAKRTFEVALALHQYKRDEISVNVIFYQNLTSKEFVDYDIIVFQRLGANEGIITPKYQKQLFQWMEQYRDQTTYVYDMDDYVFEHQNGFPITMMKRCHWALAPNDFLAEKMMAYQPRCHIIRTHIDLKTAEKTPKITFSAQFANIGWFSIGAQGIDIIDSIYSKLLEKWEGKILIHAYVHPHFIPMLKQRYQQRMVIPYPIVPLREMYSLEKGFDVLINPLSSHDALNPLGEKPGEDQKLNFINSKSEIKYLHAGAAKKPLIVTPNPAYRKAVSHGVTGFLAETPEEWIKYLDLLLTHPETREQIGKNAYKHITESYTYQQVAHHYAQFFQDLKCS